MERAVRLFRLLAKNAGDAGVKGDAVFWLGQHYLDNKEEKEGLALLEGLASSDKTSRGARARMAIGLYYFEKGRVSKENYSLAYDEFVKVVFLFKDLKEEAAQATYYAAFSQYLRGNGISARKLLDRLSSRYGDTTWAAKGQALKGRIR